jgi:CRISPR-associated exonuclease Cas4
MKQLYSNGTFAEDDLLPLSALADIVFCERRAALHHIEKLWEDNIFTAQGTVMHQHAHELRTEVRENARIVRGLRLRSLTLGLTGKADVVEFHRLPDAGRESTGYGELPPGTDLKGVSGQWQPFPVEYKRGRLRHEEGYEIQLCAQALCLEEMLEVAVPSGAIYYGRTRRRLEVAFDDKLRAQTDAAAARLHELVREGKTPAARYEKKCEKCSLLPLCMPKALGVGRSAQRYLANVLRETASQLKDRDHETSS